MAGYLIGRFGGRPLVDKVGRYILLTHKDLDRAEAWFARRGEPFVLFGRFIPLLRSFVSLAAGLGEMAVGKFLAFTVIGCAIWCAALASIGYSLGASWHHVIKAFSYAGYVVGALIVVAVIVAIVHRFRVVRAEKAAATEGRHVRAPLGRRRRLTSARRCGRQPPPPAAPGTSPPARPARPRRPTRTGRRSSDRPLRRACS